MTTREQAGREATEAKRSGTTAFFLDWPQWCVLPIKGRDMERLNPFWFYQIGAYLRVVAELPKGTTMVSGYRYAEYAQMALRTIRDQPLVPLPKCRRLAAELLDDLDVAFQPPDHEIDESVLKLIATKIQHLESVMSTEVADLEVFRVLPKGIYLTRALIEQAEDNLTELARTQLSPEMKADLREAGLCLGFEAFTASGFHSLRALEGVARRYQDSVTKSVLPRATLGDIVSDLVKFHEREPDPKKRDAALALVISLLRRVKDVRDRIMHPELVLDEDRARQVFSLACTAIDAMEEDVAARALRVLPQGG